MRRPSEVQIVQDVAFVFLNGSDRIAIVDLADAERVAGIGWSLFKGRYAHGGSGRRTWLMHRLILGLDRDDGSHTDHINGDGLDNRRSNLRVVSCATNLHNTKGRRNNKSGVPGVFWDASRGRWLAFATVQKRHHHIGRFKTQDEAITARDLWVIDNRDALATTARPREYYATFTARVG